MVDGNAGDGFHVKNGGSPEVRGNEICKCDGHGVHVCREGKGTFFSNQIHGNRRDGMTIRSGGSASFKENIVFGNGGQGVNVCDDGEGLCEGNKVS